MLSHDVAGGVQISGESVLPHDRSRRRPGDRPGIGQPQVGQPDRGHRRGGVVAPQAGARVEPVVAQQPVPVIGDNPDGLGEVVGDGIGDEVVKVDTDPARFDPITAAADLAFEGS